MSSGEDGDFNEENKKQKVSLKRRRLQRACDVCRRRKVRCDFVQLPSGSLDQCLNCFSAGYECTFTEETKKRRASKRYTESLEKRVERSQRLLELLCPDPTLRHELTREGSSSSSSPSPPSITTPLPTQDYETTVAKITRRNPLDLAAVMIRAHSERARFNNNCDEDDSDDDDDDEGLLHLSVRGLRLDSEDNLRGIFIGKSSERMLVMKAMEMKKEYSGRIHRDDDVEGTDTSTQTQAAKRFNRCSDLGQRRPVFWAIHPWEISAFQTRRLYSTPFEYSFPPPALLHSLVDLYFKHTNVEVPLLHRPTFYRAMQDNLHEKDASFGATALLVCAVGAMFSDDPLVRYDSCEDNAHSNGWKWFEQAFQARCLLDVLSPPNLYDLQLCCLVVLFLRGSSVPQACWAFTGIGIRLAQDVGAHRRTKVFRRGTITAEDELWKRAFWVLICFDRTLSAMMGRPCALQDEDFDLDMPIECDDEYWDHPDPHQRFKQPPEKPSLISGFNLFIRLSEILGMCLRTIYSIDKTKTFMGFIGQEWEQPIVAALDAAMGKWLDSIPPHLRWDPQNPNEDFFNQSSILHAMYYHIQILIHRQFIPSPSRPSPISFPSFAICNDAAHACATIADAQLRRNSTVQPIMQMALFTAVIILLLKKWKIKGFRKDVKDELVDTEAVETCMKGLKACEKTFFSAGRLWDVLVQLASVQEVPFSHLDRSLYEESEKSNDNSKDPVTSLYQHRLAFDKGDGIYLQPIWRVVGPGQGSPPTQENFVDSNPPSASHHLDPRRDSQPSAPPQLHHPILRSDTDIEKTATTTPSVSAILNADGTDRSSTIRKLASLGLSMDDFLPSSFVEPNNSRPSGASDMAMTNQIKYRHDVLTTRGGTFDGAASLSDYHTHSTEMQQIMDGHTLSSSTVGNGSADVLLNSVVNSTMNANEEMPFWMGNEDGMILSTALDLDDWGAYLTGISELTYGYGGFGLHDHFDELFDVGGPASMF